MNETSEFPHGEEETVADSFDELDKSPVDQARQKTKIKDKVARGISTGAESMSSVVRKALLAREHVLMVRVNEDTLVRINQLMDAGLFRSRSEAAASLIAEGIAAKAMLFEHIVDKTEKINKLKEELRQLAEKDFDIDLSPEHNNDNSDLDGDEK
ncbi:hypothetical protein K8I28_11510 [bacterium]|nr:hypothetical protein [bacterium]